MKQKQLIKERTISTERLYASIESANWLLARDVMTEHCRKEDRVFHQSFSTQKIEMD